MTKTTFDLECELRSAAIRFAETYSSYQVRIARKLGLVESDADQMNAAEARLRDAARAWVGAEMAEGCKQDGGQ